MSKTSDINIRVHLDENNIPERMEWKAESMDAANWKKNDALILSLWDSEEQNALRIDLWTKDMRVDDMNYFVFQTIMTLSETYENATQNEELARKMRGFAEYFAEKAEVFKNGGGPSDHNHEHDHGHDHQH